MTNADFLSRMSYDIRDKQSDENEKDRVETKSPMVSNEPDKIGNCCIDERSNVQTVGTDTHTTQFENRTEKCSKPVNILSYLFQAESQVNDTHPLDLITQFTKITVKEMSDLQNSDSQLKPLIAYLLSDELPFQRKLG